MASKHLAPQSPYSGKVAIISTKHAKSIAIAPPLWNVLKMSTLEYVWDTDELPTAGDQRDSLETIIERARQKCELALNRLGPKAEYVIATEGSFTTPSLEAFGRSHTEVIYFIDRPRKLHFHLSLASDDTIFRRGHVSSLDDLFTFAEQAKFPSHLILMRPSGHFSPSPVQRQIDRYEDLAKSFSSLSKLSADRSVYVETDMRAWTNPSRMQVIRELSHLLAMRLDRLSSEILVSGSPL